MSSGLATVGVRLRRCLVVVHDPVSRAQVTTALTRSGAEAVIGAADAYAAFRLTQARAAWDLVVINLDAPGVNGFELYSRLRAAAGRDLAVIFLTAQPNRRSVDVAEGRPAVPLVRWPGTPGEIAAAIHDGLAWAAD
jgi:CheY-like chemotaxis protein